MRTSDLVMITDDGFKGPAIFGDRHDRIDEAFVKCIRKDCRDRTAALPVRDLECGFPAGQFKIVPERFCRLVADHGGRHHNMPRTGHCRLPVCSIPLLCGLVTISPSAKERASAGQTATQAPQPEHFPVSQTSLFKSR